MRMLMNNLDPEVAERPEDLVVYGGTGRAARSWEAYDAIVRTLRTLGDDETLLVQSGKPVGVFRTHPHAPRVLISNAMLVPKWADWDTFRELEQAGLTMYGQMTAGSWIYIGTQGILQGTYETLAECATQRFGGTLAGTVTLTGGLGGMGGAQPLAVTMNGGVALCVEVDPARIERRIATRYLDRATEDLEEALAWAADARAAREAVSIGLRGNCAEVLPALVARGWQPEIVTDQTSAHDPLGGYVPAGLSLEDAARLRDADPGGLRTPRVRFDGGSRRRDRHVPGARRRGVRLRQQPASGRRGRRSGARPRVRLPRVRPRLRAADVLRGQGPVPVGGALGRPGGHRADGPGRRRAVPRGRAPPALARVGRRARRLPGPARQDLLARLRGPRAGGSALQRDGGLGRAVGADRDRPRPPGQRHRSRARTGRRRRWPTDRTRSPTGRSSTPS